MNISNLDKEIKRLDLEYESLNDLMLKNRRDRDVFQKQLDFIKTSNLDFPIHSNRDRKITFILENFFKRAVPMHILESKYTELNGKHEKLSNVMRRLKKEGVLASVRYNKQNQRTFWGLKKWMKYGDFDENHKPIKDLMPFRVQHVEML